MRKGVKFYGINDMAAGYNLTKVPEIIESFDISEDYSDINRIIEFYNIKKYFENQIYLSSWDESNKSQYIAIVEQFPAAIGKFFSKLKGDDICNFFEKVDFLYRQDFWDIIECHRVYKKITSEQFRSLMQKAHILNHVLYCRKLVQHFGVEITNELTSNVEYAEMLLQCYVVEHKNQDRKLYMPSQLTSENKLDILRGYISWDKANPNYLNLISMLKKSEGLTINDRVRYEAHQKFNEYWQNKENTRSIVWQEYETSVSFYNDEKGQDQPFSNNDKRTIEFAYGTSWIKENLDFPTLLNNFIYMFEFVDEQFRFQPLSNSARLSTLEKVLGVSGCKEYKTGIDYQIRRTSSFAQMVGYLQQLELYNIKLESVFKWFFESYLPQEFHAEGFCYLVPSEQASLLEKILLLIVQFDSILRQFRYYTEDKFVNRDFFEFSSDPYKISDTPSMIAEKYIYPKSDRIQTAMQMFYSDQSLLYYTGEEAKWNNLPHLLSSRKMKISDFQDFNQPEIRWLIKEGFVCLDEQEYVTIKPEVAHLLKDFFENGVVSYPYYKMRLPFMVDQIVEWLNKEDVEGKQTLFTIQEQEFIDYMLNVQKYNNGPELRNKYAHGMFPLNEKAQEQNYIELLNIMVLVIIKINEEFCILNPD